MRTAWVFEFLIHKSPEVIPIEFASSIAEQLITESRRVNPTFLHKKGWIDEFDTEEIAREYASRESGELYNSDKYAVVRSSDDSQIALYQSGVEIAF